MFGLFTTSQQSIRPQGITGSRGDNRDINGLRLRGNQNQIQHSLFTVCVPMRLVLLNPNTAPQPSQPSRQGVADRIVALHHPTAQGAQQRMGTPVGRTRAQTLVALSTHVGTHRGSGRNNIGTP